MNWITAYQLILLDTHRGGNATDQKRAQIALAHALRRYSTTPFYFNSESALMKVTKGVQDYGFGTKGGWSAVPIGQTSIDVNALEAGVPYDLASPTLVYIQTTGITWTPLPQKSIDEMRWYTYNSETLGYPSIYCWYNERMYFYAIPNQDYTVRLDYLKEIEVPQVIFEGTDFRVVIEDPQNPGSVIDVPNDWTSPFLVEADDLVTARARWEIYSHHQDDAENAGKEGSVIEDAMGRLRRKTDDRQFELNVQPVEI